MLADAMTLQWIVQRAKGRGGASCTANYVSEGSSLYHANGSNAAGTAQGQTFHRTFL